MGLMTRDEVERRIAKGETPSEISLLGWKRQVKVFRKLIDTLGEEEACTRINELDGACALCIENGYNCNICILEKVSCGHECTDEEHPFQRHVDYLEANRAEDALTEMNEVVELLEKCVEAEKKKKARAKP